MSTNPPRFPRWTIIRNFLDPWDHRSLLTAVRKHEDRFVPTTIASSKGGERAEIAHRSSRKLSAAVCEWKELLRPRLEALFPSILPAVGLRAQGYDSLELEIVASNDGDHFGRHIDTLYGGAPGGEKSARFLSGVYYFFSDPRAFSGGELRFYTFFGSSSEFFDIEPQDNSIIFFPSFAPHEVRPVRCATGAFADSRFTVNCWFHRAHS